VPATLTRYIDINETAQLQKFGLHNGEPNDRNNLSEKWEGMALAPALDPANPNDYFLFVTNDNVSSPEMAIRLARLTRMRAGSRSIP